MAPVHLAQNNFSLITIAETYVYLGLNRSYESIRIRLDNLRL